MSESPRSPPSRSRSPVNEQQPLLSHQSDPHGPPSPSRSRYQGSIRSYEPRSRELPDPLSSWSVRSYRWILLLLEGSAFILSVALLVDSYKSLGITAPQGSGFDIFTTIALSGISLFISLSYYKIPSKFDSTISYATAIVLLVDVVMVLSVPELRHRSGVGALAFVFALFVFWAGGFANDIVFKAKRAEDVRLYGHYDSRRTLTEWFEVLLFNIVRLLLLVGVILVSANLIIDAADSNLSPLGQIVPVDVDGDLINIHVACTPAGKGPLVIAESGHYGAEESVRWIIGSDNIGAVCYWDRPGRGFSDNAPSPLAVGNTVDILMDALEIARPGYRNESTILVSHGVGSLYSRVLAAKLGKSAKGLMFVDGLHEELFYDTWGLLRSIWHFILGVVAPVRPGKLVSVLQQYGAGDRIYGRLEHLSPRYQKSYLQELASASRQSRRDIGDATLALAPHIPLLVVSSSERCKDQQWSTYQRLLLKLSDNVLAWKIIEGPHELWRNSKSSKQLSNLLESLAKYI